MSSRFHLAIPVGDISTAIEFYCNVLGCEKGNSEFKYPDAWVDINFWGNELTLHSSEEHEKPEAKRHNVDMGNVTVPHFGVHGTSLSQTALSHDGAYVNMCCHLQLNGGWP